MTQVQRASGTDIRSTASLNGRSGNKADSDFVTLLKGEASQQIPGKAKESAFDPNKGARQTGKEEDDVQAESEEKEPDTLKPELDCQPMLSQWLAFQNSFIESETEKGEVSDLIMGWNSLKNGSSVPEEIAPVMSVENEGISEGAENTGFMEVSAFNAAKKELLFPNGQAGEKTEGTVLEDSGMLDKKPIANLNQESSAVSVEKTSGLRSEKTEEGGREESVKNSGTESGFSERVAGENRTLSQSASIKPKSFKTSFSGELPRESIRMTTSEASLVKDTADAVVSRLPFKNGELNLELEPASLGKLTIRVAFEGGRTAVTVMSSNPKTLEILSQNVSQMAQILEERTGQQTVVYTPQSADTGSQPDQNRSGYQEHRHERQEQKKESESFAQQLRLGLV